MSDSAAVAPARTSVTVEVPRQHAFAVFTERFDSWWPRSHYTGVAELAGAYIEPRQGGRWFCRGTDGSEGDWGKVLVWDPPSRLVLAWQLDADFSYNPDFFTEVEVTFTAEGPNRTTVALEHRKLERYGDRSEELRRSLGSGEGWPRILLDFVESARNSMVS